MLFYEFNRYAIIICGVSIEMRSFLHAFSVISIGFYRPAMGYLARQARGKSLKKCHKFRPPKLIVSAPAQPNHTRSSCRQDWSGRVDLSLIPLLPPTAVAARARCRQPNPMRCGFRRRGAGARSHRSRTGTAQDSPGERSQRPEAPRTRSDEQGGAEVDDRWGGECAGCRTAPQRAHLGTQDYHHELQTDQRSGRGADDDVEAFLSGERRYYGLFHKRSPTQRR